MSTFDAITAGLNALPPTVDPYAALAASLRVGFYPKVTDGFGIAIRVCQAVFALGLAFSLGGIALSVYQRSIWLCRLRETPIGRLVQVNTTLIVFLLAGIVQGSMVYEAQVTIAAYYGEGRLVRRQTISF